MVTSFPVPAQPVAHGLRRANALANRRKPPEVMRWYRDFIPKAPEDAERVLRLPHRATGSRPFRNNCTTRKCAASCGATRDRQEQGESGIQADSDVQDARARPRRSNSASRTAKHVRSALSARACSGTGRPISSTSCTDEAIALPRGMRLAELPTMQSSMHLYPVDGAVHESQEERRTAVRFATHDGPK